MEGNNYYGQPGYPIQNPTPKKRWSVKRKVTVFVLLGVLVTLLMIGTVVGFTMFLINSQTDTVQYETAYRYVVESEDFKALGVSEDALKLVGFSSGTVVSHGQREKYAEYSFSVKGTSADFEITLFSVDGNTWTVEEYDFDR